MIGLLLAVAGCSESDQVDCGGPVEWTSFEATVISVAETESGSSGEHAEVVARDDAGSEHTIEVWGQPADVRTGDRYRFEVANTGEAFVGYDGDTSCYGDQRLSLPVDSAEADRSETSENTGSSQEVAAAWTPDIDGDGAADAVTVDGSLVQFWLTIDGAPMLVLNSAGEPISLTLGESQTFTCTAEGVISQRLDEVGDELALRFSTLVVEDGRGRWGPTPSFFVASDSTLPRAGRGCPIS